MQKCFLEAFLSNLSHQQNRFMAFVEPIPIAGCWLWTGGTNPKGYGYFYPTSSETRRAHRFSWELFVGPIPRDMLVLHKCDVPSCVNPDHLYLGSAKDNASDRDRKGRNGARRGEEHSNAKLTAIQVSEIKNEKYSRDLSAMLASKYDVSQATIRAIRAGRRWAVPILAKMFSPAAQSSASPGAAPVVIPPAKP